MAGKQKVPPILGAVEQLMSAQRGFDPSEAKYPKSTRAQRGTHNLRYFQTLGVPQNDKAGAAMMMNKAMAANRKGEVMDPSVQKLVDAQLGFSQEPGQVAARLQARKTRPASKDDDRPKSASKTADEISSVQRSIDAPAWSFKGSKAPYQEDIDMVLNAEGADRKEALNAFREKFGDDAVNNFLAGDD